jgi:DNA-binding MarR family transcriptional regulator
MSLDSFQNTAGYLVHEVTRLLNREFDQRMLPLGLTRAQWWVLASLYFDDGVMQTELARDLGFSKVALGGLLDRLEAKGWVERRPHPADRRANLVYRTAKVEGLLATMRDVAEEINRDLVSALSPQEHKQLVASLQTLKATLAAQG